MVSTGDPELSSTGQAGPSRSPSPSRPRSKPTTTTTTTTVPPMDTSPIATSELSTLDTSLAARRRRRRSSIFNTFSSTSTPLHKGKARAGSHNTSAGEDALREVNGNGDWEEGERRENEEIDRLERQATAIMEEYRKQLPGRVEMKRGGTVVDPGADDDVDGEGGEGVGTGGKQEFVWDVLFENQRGIYLLGKGYFSSRTLLPSDPSAFTLPSHPLPSASSFTVSRPPSKPAKQKQKQKGKKAKAHPQMADPSRAIKTFYTPQTFQTPSPAWEWLTPWMVNMRESGTDEQGWKYNAWFKSGGWSSHAGPVGWWGWVRRREWVRLRATRPPERKVTAEEGRREDVKREREREEGDGEEGGTVEDVEAKELRAVLKEEGPAGKEVDSLKKVLGKIPLDRERVETVRRWLDNGDESDLKQLQGVLDDDQAVESLSRAFTHRSSVPALLDLFETHHLAVHSPLSSPSRGSSTLPSST